MQLSCAGAWWGPFESRFIVCDGLRSARLWSRIGAGSNEVLSWVPRGEESARSRTKGFNVLSGGLVAEAIAKLGATADDEFAFVTEDPAFARAAVAIVSDEIEPQVPVLVLSDAVGAADLPPHPCLRATGLRSLIRDDVDDEFSMLGNLRRVVAVRTLLERREKVGILLQPDPDPDGIAGGYALRAVLGRRRPTATADLVRRGEAAREHRDGARAGRRDPHGHARRALRVRRD
jgi:hypothetical protein